MNRPDLPEIALAQCDRQDDSDIVGAALFQSAYEKLSPLAPPRTPTNYPMPDADWIPLENSSAAQANVDERALLQKLIGAAVEGTKPARAQDFMAIKDGKTLLEALGAGSYEMFNDINKMLRDGDRAVVPENLRRLASEFLKVEKPEPGDVAKSILENKEPGKDSFEAVQTLLKHGRLKEAERYLEEINKELAKHGSPLKLELRSYFHSHVTYPEAYAHSTETYLILSDTSKDPDDKFGLSAMYPTGKDIEGTWRISSQHRSGDKPGFGTGRDHRDEYPPYQRETF